MSNPGVSVKQVLVRESLSTHMPESGFWLNRTVCFHLYQDTVFLAIYQLQPGRNITIYYLSAYSVPGSELGASYALL